MSPIDEYLKTVDESARDILAHFYTLTRRLVPDATEGVSYGMPTFLYKGKGLVAIIRNKDFFSIYPFCNLDVLHMEDAFVGFETTKGSLHFTFDHPADDALFTQILQARIAAIDAGYGKA